MEYATPSAIETVARAAINKIALSLLAPLLE
jgi:hypothetical protein